MTADYKILTNEVIDAYPDQSGFIPVGLSMVLKTGTVLRLYVDTVDGIYQPAIVVMSNGLPCPPVYPDSPFVFNLLNVTGLILCVRGLKFNAGKPAAYLVETYRKKRPPLTFVK